MKIVVSIPPKPQCNEDERYDIELEVAPDELVDSLKAMIQEKSGIEPKNQRVMYASQRYLHIFENTYGRKLSQYEHANLEDGAEFRVEDHSLFGGVPEGPPRTQEELLKITLASRVDAHRPLNQVMRENKEAEKKAAALAAN